MKSIRYFLMMAIYLIPVLLSAQQNGRITGLIEDAEFNPIAGATVRLTNLSISLARQQTTGADGAYTFVEVPPGRGHILTVEAPGFEPQITDEFELAVNQVVFVRPPISLTRVQVQAAAPVQPPLRRRPLR